MLDELLLLAGNDIPFTKARLTVHQPSLQEIGYIGEEAFFTGCQLLNFTKDVLSDEDKVNLQNATNFDIFMTIMTDKQSTGVQRNKICAIMVLAMIFPDYAMVINQDNITFTQRVEEGQEPEVGQIDNTNYEDFKQILIQMFCLHDTSEQEYIPKGKQAQAIAEKLKRGRQIAAEIKGEKTHKISVLNRYMSILSTGLSIPYNVLSKYTVYQLFDEFERFNLKQNFDINLQIRLAGAKDVEEVDNWMKDIHEEGI